MNPTTKNMLQFFATIIGLSVVFSLFTGKTLISIVIGIFLSITMYYSPKKVKKLIGSEEVSPVEKTQ